MSKASKLLSTLKSSADTANQSETAEGVLWLPSSCLGFNVATGGGAPQGRLIEYMGEFSSGKSLTAYDKMVETQRQGGLAILVDAESSYEPDWGEKLGINNEELLVYPSSELDTKSKDEQAIKRSEIAKRSVEKVSAFMEDIICKCRKFYPKPLPVTIVVDSVTALTTLKEAEGDMDTSAKDMTKAQKLGIMYGRLVGIAKKELVTVIFINQMRERIATGNRPLLGDKTKSTGGKGLEFYASLRVKFTKAGFTEASKGIKSGKILDHNDIKIGQITRIEVIKNKLAPPYNKGDIRVNFDRFNGIYGMDPWHGLVDFLKNERIIESGGGGWYRYGDTKLGQGEEKAIATLKDNPELLEEIFGKLGIKLNFPE